jgi:hypothetical protein
VAESKGQRLERLLGELKELLELGDLEIVYKNETGQKLFLVKDRVGYGKYNVSIVTEEKAGELISSRGSTKGIYPLTDNILALVYNLQ